VSVFQALLHPSLLLAFAAFGAGNVALAAVELRWLPRLYNNPVTEWIAERVLAALARVVLLVAFILVAYPGLYGIEAAPPLSELFAQGMSRKGALVNWTFFTAMILPLVPFVGRLPGLVLPVQGIVAAALVFAWLADAVGAEVTLWPGWPAAAAIVAWSVFGQWLATLAAERLGHALARRGMPGDLDIAVIDAVILFMQAPAILLYTLTIGGQLQAG